MLPLPCRPATTTNGSLSIGKTAFDRERWLEVIGYRSGQKQGVLLDDAQIIPVRPFRRKIAVSLSLPVRIFEARSSWSDFYWIYGSMRLVFNQNKMKIHWSNSNVMCLPSQVYHCVGQSSHFNPYWVYQTILSDNVSQVCCEHTSHHLPLVISQITHPLYSVSGYFVLSEGI
jgi:hypothetical protein